MKSNTKEYWKTYYQEHKIEFLERKRKWRRKRQQEQRRKVVDNPERKTLKELFLKDYGKEFRRKKNFYYSPKRKFCEDCLYWGKEECPGWEKCPYRKEVEEAIK